MLQGILQGAGLVGYWLKVLKGGLLVGRFALGSSFRSPCFWVFCFWVLGPRFWVFALGSSFLDPCFGSSFSGVLFLDILFLGHRSWRFVLVLGAVGRYAADSFMHLLHGKEGTHTNHGSNPVT
jgi:hypothetical protein